MVCVTDACSLLQNAGTLLHWTAMGGSMELIEWLMAHYALEVGVKTKVLLALHMRTCYSDVRGC